MALFTKNLNTKGFTLVEMVVVAPIIILAIGAFIAVIINLTGEVLSSRGSNSLTYDVQDALNRIETDVKLSATTLATNSISLTGTNQGFVADGQATPGGSTVNFSNISTGGLPASLILNVLATNGNPLSDTTTYLYLKDTPNSCADPALYTKNTPLTTNVVYYIANDTLWRRTIMPQNYATAANLCGGTSWQRPSCLPGYTNSFCKTNDEKLIEGITPADFAVSYYTSASATTPIAAATTGTDAARGIALQGAQMIKVSLTAKKTIAGRDIQRSGTVQVTRLDTNASGIATDSTPTAAPPTAPIITRSVYDGHRVRFTWSQVPTASSYDVSFSINGGAYTPVTSIDNNTRKLEVVSAWHSDSVTVRVAPRNAVGVSTSVGTSTITIPVWAPLILKGSWSDFDSGWSSAAYTRLSSGLILIKGLIKNPTAPAAGSVIATLPPDYRPEGGTIFYGTALDNGGAAVSGRLDVALNGNITLASSHATISWISLNPIRFSVTAGVTPSVTRIFPTLEGTFTNSGGGLAPVSYVKDSTGRVSIQGAVSNGVRADNTLIFKLPTSHIPPLVQHMPSRSSVYSPLGVGTIVAGNPGVYTKTTSSGTLSLNTHFIPSSTATTWTNLSLVNGWVAHDAAVHPTAQYTITTDGSSKIVTLRGLIRGGSATWNTAIATLPVAARPGKSIILSTTNTSEFTRIDIGSNGVILFLGSNNTWLSLDGLSFVVGQ